MAFLPTCVRWITNLCLLLALILTVFLLSGTTAPAAGVRNIHVVKIELNSTRLTTVASTSEVSSSTPSLEPTSIPILRSSTKSSTPLFTPVSGFIGVRLTKTMVTSSTNIPVATLPTAKTTAKPTKPSTTSILVLKRNADVEYPHKIGSYDEDIAYKAEVTLGENKLKNSRAVLLTRDHRTGRESAPAVDEYHSDEGTVVVIGYFGVCAMNTTTNWVCTKSRGKVERLEGAPQDLLELAASIQGAISPLPPIITVTLQGLLMFMSCFLGCRYTINLNSKLGQGLAVLAFASFSGSLFTAILFQSASRLLYGALSTSNTMIVSKGNGGVALAWAAVFFTGLAMLGVLLLLLISEATQQAKRRTKELTLVSMFLGKGKQKREHDVEIQPLPPVHRRGTSSPRGREGDPYRQTGNLKQSPVYVEKVKSVKRGNKQLGNEWNMI